MSAGPGGPRRLVVLRHGETTHNAAGIWQGQLDSPLSARGEQQAAAVGPALAALRPTRVVTSDLQRARRTGESVARACGVPLHEDARLREIHAGRWQGLTNAQVTERWPQERAAVLSGEDVRRGGDGETMADVVARVAEALEEVLGAMGAGECVVVSTHGAAGRAGVGWLLGLEHRVAWRVLGGLGNCHWGELVEGRDGWRLQAWNASAGAGGAGPATPP
ncbi:histidine phosphatase family protein [Phycicoccus endophyticus]|uniref:Histidine phosphatase family protein n=1 Tax=Phycicoccus endophyticus TaxID=1690220 RepID=A0A7G9R5B0_9MICO|nr:histidine phosphatase family protein [Phycicoccus endophyticus]NHI20952.1 histidine phosphatase family protein [Phycicoccus endophyticus]QNN50785.1 histidine phosphatase family protein [Phycicoccus endophyticus]GGL40298.1 phosphoglycerate mutase [Phycicoccus endophyticus]